MTQSKDQQVKVVVVGMALGVLAQGVEAVTSKKMALEFAFNYAWRRWSQSTRFPRIGGHNPGSMFWIGPWQCDIPTAGTNARGSRIEHTPDRIQDRVTAGTMFAHEQYVRRRVEVQV